MTGEAVEDEEQVKGYPKGEGDYVLLEDEEIEDIGLESTRTIDIETFVPIETIGWIWYDRPHYLTPEDDVSAEAFAVIREAMAVSGVAGIARLVMYRRERAVLLVPKDEGIVTWTLRYGSEVRDAKNYFDDADIVKPTSQHLTMMKKLIKGRTEPWNPSMADDPVQDNLLNIIAERNKTKKVKKQPKAKQEEPSNVIDIMSALKKSLASERKVSPK